MAVPGLSNAADPHESSHRLQSFNPSGRQEVIRGRGGDGNHLVDGSTGRGKLEGLVP